MPSLHSSISPAAIVQMQKVGHLSFNSTTGSTKQNPPRHPQDERVYEMAVLDLIHVGSHRNEAAGNGTIAKFVADIRNHMARRSVYRQTVHELSQLSDRELADLGLSRAAIRSTAYEAAWAAK